MVGCEMYSSAFSVNTQLQIVIVYMDGEAQVGYVVLLFCLFLNSKYLCTLFV